MAPDPTWTAKGRGVYTCPTRACIGDAVRRGGFARSFRGHFRGQRQGPEELIKVVMSALSEAREESRSPTKAARLGQWLAALGEGTVDSERPEAVVELSPHDVGAASEKGR